MNSYQKPLLSGRVEKDGWVFTKALGAYAAVHPAAGKWQWQTDDMDKSGQWMVPDDPWAPVIIEVARKGEVSSYQEFQRRLATLSLKYGTGILEYTSREGNAFTFHTDSSQPPKINATAVDFQAQASFASPFIQSARDSGIVNIKKGQRALRLDFNQP
jgi:hypothetical protein